jgi:hypothetical protein
MSDQLPARREETPEGLIAVWSPFENVTDFAVQTTLPTLEPAQRAVVLDIIEGEALHGGDLINADFLIRDYIAHPVDLTNEETGEVVSAVRMLLLHESHPPIAFVSLGILKSMGRLAWMLGREPPFDPPVLVRLKQVSTRGARRTFKLVPAKE